MNWKLCQAKLLDDKGKELEEELNWQTLFVGSLEDTYDLARDMGFWGCKFSEFKDGTSSCSCQIDDYLLLVEKC